MITSCIHPCIGAVHEKRRQMLDLTLLVVHCLISPVRLHLICTGGRVFHSNVPVETGSCVIRMVMHILNRWDCLGAQYNFSMHQFLLSAYIETARQRAPLPLICTISIGMAIVRCETAFSMAQWTPVMSLTTLMGFPSEGENGKRTKVLSASLRKSKLEICRTEGKGTCKHDLFAAGRDQTKANRSPRMLDTHRCRI